MDSRHKGALRPLGHNHELGPGWLWPRLRHYHTFEMLWFGDEEMLQNEDFTVISSRSQQLAVA